ncbi:hypothetical protein OUZ56_008262 [Daphnia magna]|uniref:Uncharacterized protein n=1 Tax=Daphnia magna TaxID=35525 RepID=A0ABR0ACF2_9CRUS|nr:hypothetical protein OUZ56_008262 [Daphnia magna]
MSGGRTAYRTWNKSKGANWRITPYSRGYDVQAFVDCVRDFVYTSSATMMLTRNGGTAQTFVYHQHGTSLQHKSVINKHCESGTIDF